MPLLWQPVCKYLLTQARTKQCHCTSRWFRPHGSAEYVRVRHRDIHGAVVCIPGRRPRMHVRVDVQRSCVGAQVVSMYRLGSGEHVGHKHNWESEKALCFPPISECHFLFFVTHLKRASWCYSIKLIGSPVTCAHYLGHCDCYKPTTHFIGCFTTFSFWVIMKPQRYACNSVYIIDIFEEGLQKQQWWRGESTVEKKNGHTLKMQKVISRQLCWYIGKLHLIVCIVAMRLWLFSHTPLW